VIPVVEILIVTSVVFGLLAMALSMASCTAAMVNRMAEARGNEPPAYFHGNHQFNGVSKHVTLGK